MEGCGSPEYVAARSVAALSAAAFVGASWRWGRVGMGMGQDGAGWGWAGEGIGVGLGMGMGWTHKLSWTPQTDESSRCRECAMHRQCAMHSVHVAAAPSTQQNSKIIKSVTHALRRPGR